jgi:predicted nucleic acid-binding protein
VDHSQSAAAHAMIFDTMVLAFYLLDVEDHFAEADRAVETADAILCPQSMRAEFLSTIWQWIVFRNVTLETGLQAIHDLDGIVDEFVPIAKDEAAALELAVLCRHSTYDTLFVALARRLETKGVTYDQAMRRLFPDDVLTVEEFLAGKR